MTDTELLEKVKAGLGLSGEHTDTSISIKMLAVKGYMINAGVSVEQVETDLGVACLTVGVNDIWDLTSGEVKFSPAFDIILWQLKVVSMP